jgi:membrane fusion protein (multidrug efflux system)
MAVVPIDDLWVDANFKEDQLANLRLGQPVRLTADLYGSQVVFHGKVEGIAMGTGSAFALLPAQNASGNWIKIVQRVPVRIALDKNELRQHPLRLGLSMRVEVDTRDRSGAVLVSTRPAPSKTPVYDEGNGEVDKMIAAIVAANSNTAKVAVQ